VNALVPTAAVPDEQGPSTVPTRLTVVISKGQSRGPEKRGLESAIGQQASQIDGVEVLVIPHLYDLPKSSASLERLRECEGDLVVVSWIFPRAARWVLDRQGIAGAMSGDESSPPHESDSPRVTELYPRPNRRVDCIDLKTITDVEEVMRVIRDRVGVMTPVGLPIVGGRLHEIQETTGRRWYPVIDFDRCTNCMECVDFCLFGVYGLDGSETILVEQPDNCRKGCPACSRVCPENAIMFPQHKAPAIAGAEVEGEEGFKIDLSQLFGAPVGSDDPIATAARERDEQLLLTGRQAVGIDDQLRRRQCELITQPKDALDRLIDSLDGLDL
jgi:NAD-dependent dihydropyrimidine dehydrogenase PreA subunit